MRKHSPSKFRLNRKLLRQAMSHIGWLGFTYQGRRKFWAKQAPLLRLYLEDAELSSKALDSISTFLSATGLVEDLTEPIGRKSCAVLGTQITAPCNNQHCSYWGDYPSRFNCISAYLLHRANHNLSIAEMAVFSGFSRVYVNNIFNQALQKLRQAAHTDLRDESFDPTNQVIHVPGVCVVCGSQTDIQPGFIGSFDHPFTYCSLPCWASRRPQIMAMEERFGVSIGEILAHLAKRFSSMEEAASCLNLNVDELTDIVRAECATHTLLDGAGASLRVRVRGQHAWERQANYLRKMSELLDRTVNSPSPVAIPN